MANRRNGTVQPNSNVQNTDILHITMPLINQMKVADRAESTIIFYLCSVERFVRHSSLQTTLIYLQISETPLVPDFSPLDIWEDDCDQEA